jgi:hypothetical protein
LLLAGLEGRFNPVPDDADGWPPHGLPPLTEKDESLYVHNEIPAVLYGINEAWIVVCDSDSSQEIHLLSNLFYLASGYLVRKSK